MSELRYLRPSISKRVKAGVSSLVLAAFLVGCSAPSNSNGETPTLPIVTTSSYSQVNELMAQMTLDEKLAQISCIWFDKKKGERTALNDSTVVRSLTGRNAANTAELINSIQKWHVEETRLGIPTLFHEEGLHGFQAYQATSFPQSIALAATFDTDLVQEVYSITAREIRARGAHHVLSPVVDIALDPRWGRIEETYGEDPYLVSRMGVAAVKGFQGDSFPIADDKVVATLKHMTGHGQPEAGMNVGPSQISDRELYERFFPPFKAAIREGNAASVMASYNEIDGVPSHANSWLLNDVLRGEWGFDGVVVADYFAINELQGRHRIVDNIGDAGAIALRSGVDLELPDGVAFYELKERVESGEFNEALIDQAVRRVLEMKMRANLFETPFADPEYADAITGNQEARDLAEEAARKAAVLLKNEDNILPLDRSKYKKIAVIGPNAAITVLGGYSDEPRQTVSILEGIQNKVGDTTDIVHSQGVTLTDNRSWWDDEVNLIDPDQNMSDILKAVSAAKDADLIILAIGGDESTSREAWSESHMGDRNDITLIGQQKELVDALAETGKPMVSVIISGRPLSLVNVQDNLDAILYGWILGQETGTAVADLLFGDANPSGKMPVTVPRSVGDIPAFYNHKPTARRGYAFADASPLYVFGEGMSYTTFDISEPVLASPTIGVDGKTSVSVTVTNSGDMAGDEIIQLYINDKISTVTRNVKDLKGFERVSLEPGETKTVTLPITKESLWFYNLDMERVVEPGEFDIMVGNSSESVKTATLTVQ